MPSKKKKYNARFPAGRIKKIMQSDEEVGKVAQAVPVIISRTLELFVESLLTKTLRITNSRNAKTLSPSHMKQCIMSESRFDFLRELVKNIPDISVAEESSLDNSPETPSIYGIDHPLSFDKSKPSTSCGVIVRPTSTATAANGLRISVDTSNISLASSSSSPQPLDCRTQLKRQWDSMERTPPIISNSIAANFYKENSVIQHTSDSIEGVSPPKLSRTDSAPPPKTSYNSTSRRLQHQSKSIPCTSKDAGTPTTPQPPVVAPPPIVNIDLCNTPIVKIDYSNLALPDMEQIENPATKHHKKHRRSSSLTTANSGGVCITPVINIDLSKIAASSSLTTPLPLELDEDDYDNI